MLEFITEDQYIAVEGLINNPPPNTTDFHITAWKNHQNSYKDQQFRSGIPDLTPKKNAVIAEERYNANKKFAEIYSKSPLEVDVSGEQNSQFLTTPDAIARRVNRNYLSSIYSNDKIDSTNHDLYRTDFAKRFLKREDILTDEQFYDAVKPYVQKQFQQEETENKVQSQAVVNYYKGLPVSESLKQLGALGTPNEAKIIELHRNIDAVIAPVRPYIDRALNALERQTKGDITKEKTLGPKRGAPVDIKSAEEIAAEDEKAINDLRDILIKTHPSNRAKIMKKMMGEAESRGQATINDVRNLFNEAVDSAKNIFEGFEAFEDMNQEIALRKMQFAVGDELELITSGVKEIKTPEQARKYIMSKINQPDPRLADMSFPDQLPFIEKGLPTVALDDQSVKLLRDAKADLLSTVEFDRDVRTLEKSVDPFREGWQTTMATTVGGSVGIMGMYSLAGLAGPVGTIGALGATGAIYTGLNYEEIRAKYPDLPPDKARNVAIISGGIEALLDLGQFKVITNAFKSLGLKKGIDLAGRSAVGNFVREAGTTAGLTYIFETGIELVQEGVRPVVQSIFAEFDKEYSVNISEEWANWKDAAGHIAIGMIPLALVGGMGAGSNAVLADSYLKKEIMEEGKLAAFGLSNEQIAEVQQLVNNNMYNAAREKLKEYNKDQNVINNRQAALEKVVAANGIDQIRAYEEARKEGIIPRYTVDEATGEYTLEDGTVLPDQRAYIETTRARVAEAEQQYTQNIADLVSGKVEAEADLDINELQAKTNLLGRLKGFSQQELTTFDNIFGSNEVEQNDTYEQLIVNIAEKGNLEGIKTYIDGVYNNIPQNVRNALGKDKAEGVETLFKLVTGQSAAVRAESDLTGSNIVIQEAIHDVNFVDTPLELNNQNIELRYSDIRKQQAKGKKAKANPIEAVAISDIQETPGGNYVKSVVDFLQSNYDVRISFVRGQEVNGEYLGPIGYSEGKDIIIDIDRAKGSLLNHVIGHEFAHFLENFEDVYSEVSNAIISTVDKTTLDRYMGMFETEREAQKELVSDTFGQRFRDINFWESVTTAMYQQNPSKADSFIGIVKQYLNNIKNALSRDLANRDISNAEYSDISKMNSAIVSAMLKVRARPADGTTQGQRMEAIPNPENRSVDYVARKLRDQINAAMSQIKEVGGTEVGKKRLIQSLIEPQTEEQYNEIVAYRQQSIDRRRKKEIKDRKNIGRALRNISNKLYSAFRENIISAKLIAEAEAALKVLREARIPNIPSNLTFTEVNTLINNPEAQYNKILEYIDTFNKVRESSLNEFVNKKLKKVYDGLLKLDEIKNNSLLKNLYENIRTTLYGDINQLKGELSATYNQLYSPDGIPIELDQQEFEELITKYHILKTFGGWQYRNLNEREAAIDKAIEWSRYEELTDVQIVNPQVEEMVVNGINEVITNTNTISKTLNDIPVLGNVFSYADDHLTFASILELISPSLNTPGRPITGTLQKLSDSFVNAYHNIQDENNQSEDVFLQNILRIYDIKGPKILTDMSAGKIVNELLTKKSINIVINGEEKNITQAYAAYILNISDQFIYNNQLNAAGFTAEVLSDIQSKIDSKMDKLRIELRKTLIDIIRNQNDKFKEIGKPVMDPGEFFFPVQRKSLTTNIINGFDIAFGTGLQPNVLDEFTKAGDELNLDPDNLDINLFTIFNSNSYLAIHNANIAKPILTAKRIFSDPSVRRKLESKIGAEGIQKLFGYIRALEFGGTLNVELTKKTREFLNNLISGAARAALGFNIRTYLVNMMSMTNMLQDASIPLSTKIISYLEVIGQVGKIRGAKNSKLINRRLRNGANTLLTIARGDIIQNKPNWFKFVSDKSMEFIGGIDASFLSVAYLAAYNAHYKIGKSEGLSGAALEKFAEDGVIRTITKTSQPNMAATKAFVEQSNNPYTRILSLFLSEPRKTFGLEYAALKKVGVKPGEFAQLIFINHLVLGSINFMLRGFAGYILGEEPDDIESWYFSMLLGPLSGFMVIGQVFEVAFKNLYNAIIAEPAGMNKVRVFANEPAPIRVAKQITDFTKISSEKPLSDNISSAGQSIEAFGSLWNQSTVSSAGSLLDFIGDAIKILRLEEE